MPDNFSSNKRIAKNTVVLYVRMIVVMLITLYSSRIVLQALGVEDFGLYNVVGGVVALLSFLKTSLTSSTQRFLSYEIGTRNKEKLKSIFGNSMTAHVMISVIIVVLGETVGLWFLNAKINIPLGREFAANVIYQLSVLSTVVSMLTVPFAAAVIARERMTFFAVIGIADAVLKLGFALLLLVLSYDSLILYGVLMALIIVLNLFAYLIYCKLKFEEVQLRLSFDKVLFKEIFSFSGWTILGQMAVIGVNCGTNILINLFYSVTANAAMGIAQQVNGAITGLTSNFQTAFQPQITKSYASKDFTYMNSLIHYSSKISFFLLFIVTYPIMLNIDYILDVWLTTVPVLSNSFCILFLIASIFNALSAPLWISVFATGNIKMYQLVVSSVFFSDLIIVYILFVLGFPPVTCMIVKAVINFLVIFVRLYYTGKEVEGFSLLNYLKLALAPCFLSAIVTIAPTLPLFIMTTVVWQKVAVTIIAIMASIISTYLIGLNRNERKSVVRLVAKFIR